MDQFSKETSQAADLALALGPFATAILVDVPEGRFAVPIEDMYVGMALRHAGCYSPKELHLLRQLCSSETRALVVGAHIGALVIPLSKSCAMVTAIEANPRIYEFLHFNVHLNERANCRIIQMAASNQVETISFILNRVNSGGSKRMPAVRNPMYFHDKPDVVGVHAGPLDEVLPGESFDLIVMDIEGSEYFALWGMQRILASASALQVEFMPHHLRDVAAISVSEFLEPIKGHFSSLILPDKKTIAGRDQFESLLSAMYERGEGSEGLLFLKSEPAAIRLE